jgi:hypothetical protein
MAKKAQKKPAEIAFDYIKSNQFRVIHMNGAFGGLSPNGAEIHMALFNERRPLPRKTVYSIAGGRLGGEDLSKRESRAAFVREVEVDVIMSIESAVNLRIWLDDKIAQLTKAQQAAVDLAQKANAGQQKANGAHHKAKNRKAKK